MSCSLLKQSHLIRVKSSDGENVVALYTHVESQKKIYELSNCYYYLFGFTSINLIKPRFMAVSLHPLLRPPPPLSRSWCTWSNHLALCAPRLLVPTGFVANTILTGLLSDICATCPSQRILPALATFRILGSSYTILLSTRRSKTSSANVSPPRASSTSQARRGLLAL